jgi:hypothetical protein
MINFKCSNIFKKYWNSVEENKKEADSKKEGLPRLWSLFDEVKIYFQSQFHKQK